jgi:Sulfotransferase family
MAEPRPGRTSPSATGLNANRLPDLPPPLREPRFPAADPIPHDGLPAGIFVVGCPRSGTTLLQTLLAAHPLITSFSESDFFASNFGRLPKTAIYYLRTHPAKQVRSFLAQNGEAEGPYADLLRKLDAAGLYAPWSASTAAQLFLSLLDRWADRRDARIWLEKSPIHLWFLPLIDQAAVCSNRSIKIVHIVRDGRDVVASLYNSSKYWHTDRYTLEYCTSRWNSDLAATIRRTTGRGTDAVVFYEELVAQPQLTMQRLLSALSVPWDHHVISDREQTARRLPQSSKPHHHKLLTPIRPNMSFEGTFDLTERQWITQRLALRDWRKLRHRFSIDCPPATLDQYHSTHGEI